MLSLHNKKIWLTLYRCKIQTIHLSFVIVFYLIKSQVYICLFVCVYFFVSYFFTSQLLNRFSWECEYIITWINSKVILTRGLI